MPRNYFEIRPSQTTTDPLKACISEKSEVIDIDSSIYQYMWWRQEGNYLSVQNTPTGVYKGSKLYPCTRSEVGIPENITPPLTRVEIDNNLN